MLPIKGNRIKVISVGSLHHYESIFAKKYEKMTNDINNIRNKNSIKIRASQNLRTFRLGKETTLRTENREATSRSKQKKEINMRNKPQNLKNLMKEKQNFIAHEKMHQK